MCPPQRPPKMPEPRPTAPPPEETAKTVAKAAPKKSKTTAGGGGMKPRVSRGGISSLSLRGVPAGDLSSVA